MEQRAEELRTERGGRKKADALQATLDAIAEMPDGDRVVAERIHAIVSRVAPQLLPGPTRWRRGSRSSSARRSGEHGTARREERVVTSVSTGMLNGEIP
jgi:hypothetical protein